jgi:hypothetical protein
VYLYVYYILTHNIYDTQTHTHTRHTYYTQNNILLSYTIDDKDVILPLCVLCTGNTGARGDAAARVHIGTRRDWRMCILYYNINIIKYYYIG